MFTYNGFHIEYFAGFNIIGVGAVSSDVVINSEVTIKKKGGVDCLIAAIAIHNNLEIVHLDRDFVTLSRFTKLIQSSNFR